MQLRSHPVMCDGAVTNWPPKWIWRGGLFADKPTGEIGVLVEVLPPQKYQINLLVEHERGEYMGGLMFKDSSACQQIFEILKAHRGCTVKHIGGLDL